MILTTSLNGGRTIEPIQTDKLTNRVLPAHEIYEVRENVQFRILVTKFSKGPTTLPKIVLNAVRNKPPKMIILHDEFTPSSNAEVSKDNFIELEGL